MNSTRILRTILRTAGVLVLGCLLAGALLAQGNKKSYTFHGKVTSVDQRTNKLTVAGEKIEGWMDAMTMAYSVDNPDVIKTIKTGDQIQATVYDGDYTLHNVKVVMEQKK